MSIVSKVVGKTSDFLYRNIFYHLGYGRPDTRDNWEQAFSGDYWNFLETKEESGRYYAIVKFLNQCKKNPSVLDVGCGKGVLYQYLKQGVPSFQYTGIDISENAAKAAAKRFPEAEFSQLDFDESSLNKKFDVIIFNETLEYFKRPLETLKKCEEMNFNPGGVFIMSMFQGHDGLWKVVDKNYKTIASEDITNDKGKQWKVKLLAPL